MAAPSLIHGGSESPAGSRCSRSLGWGSPDLLLLLPFPARLLLEGEAPCGLPEPGWITAPLSPESFGRKGMLPSLASMTFLGGFFSSGFCFGQVWAHLAEGPRAVRAPKTFQGQLRDPRPLAPMPGCQREPRGRAGAEPAPQTGHPLPSLMPISPFSPQRPQARASLRPPPRPSSASLLGLDCACNPKGNQRKPTKEPPLPSPRPPLRPAPGHEAAVAGPSPPDTWKLNSAAARTLPPSPQSLFANQDTDSVFNFAMGRVE